MKLFGLTIRFCAVFTLAALASFPVRADVTLRYQTEFKPAAALKPLLEPLLKTMQAGPAVSVRMKGNKGYTTAGAWSEIFDFAKQEVTLIDPARKTFATLPASQFSDKMAGAMPQTNTDQMQAMQKAMESIKTHIDSKMTGKTAEIQGVQAEEREITLTLDVPLPTSMAQTGPTMKMTMHIWTATKEEALRVPAIRELTGYQAWQKYMMNPVGMLEKMTAKMPGMSQTVGPLLDEIFKNPSVILRTRMEIYMPFMATMAKQMAAQGKDLPGLDPDAPLLEMSQEVAELSSAPVDAALFEIPKDYTAVPADDMIQDLIKAKIAAKQN